MLLPGHKQSLASLRILCFHATLGTAFIKIHTNTTEMYCTNTRFPVKIMTELEKKLLEQLYYPFENRLARYNLKYNLKRSAMKDGEFTDV